MANVNKDSKESKEKEKESPKDGSSGGKKSKDDPGSYQKRILQELAALRADLEAVKAARISQPVPTEPPAGEVSAKNNQRDSISEGGSDTGKTFLQGLRNSVEGEKGPNPAAYVAVGYAYRRKTENGDVEGASDLCVHGGLAGILDVDNGEAARLGQALGSPQKIALVRVLIWDGPQSGAQLEEKTGLTTGSLYHHLRELIHARVIESESRSLYKITELGRQTALLLMVQAARIAER